MIQYAPNILVNQQQRVETNSGKEIIIPEAVSLYSIDHFVYNFPIQMYMYM